MSDYEEEMEDVFFPEDLLYSKEHLWVRLEGRTARIGITEILVDEIGRPLGIDLPEEGDEIEAAAVIAAITGSSAGECELFSPLSGKVAKINPALEEDPSLLISDPYDEGWFCLLGSFDKEDCEALMDAEDYEAMLSDGEY